MAYLVRKISRSKWQLTDEVQPVNADAITLCLKTSSNTLSFWRIDSLDDIASGVLAIAASNDNLDKLDIIVIDEDKILGLDISIGVTPGKTACEDLISSHRDLINLTVRDLAVVSEAIVDEIRCDKVKRYTLAKLKDLVIKAYDEGRIKPSLLSDGVGRKIGRPAASEVASGV